MKNIVRKISVFVISVLAMISVAWAGSAEIKTSSGTVEKGQTIKVTVSISSGDCTIGGYRFEVKYDSSVIEYVPQSGDEVFCNGGNGYLRFLNDPFAKSDSKTITFKAVGVGKTSLSISYAGGDILDDGYNDISIKTSAGTITVNPPYQASNDATLKSLKVGQGTLSPGFSSGTTEYSLGTVPADVTKLTISATPNHSAAKVDIQGNDLAAGDNTVKIVVTAENGDKKTYSLKVSRTAPTPTPSPTETPTPEPTATPTTGALVHGGGYTLGENGELKPGETELTIVDTITVEAPDGFDPSSLKVGDFVVDALKRNDGDTILVQLSDDKLYVYDEKSGTVYPYVTYNSLIRNYLLVQAPADKIPAGYKETGFDYEGNIYPAYRIDKDDEYLLVYTADGVWYKYDTVDNTVQRADLSEQKVIETIITVIPSISPSSAPGMSVPDDSENSSVDGSATESSKDKLVRYIITGLALLLALIFLILYIVEKKRNNSYKRTIKEQEEVAKVEEAGRKALAVDFEAGENVSAGENKPDVSENESVDGDNEPVASENEPVDGETEPEAVESTDNAESGDAEAGDSESSDVEGAEDTTRNDVIDALAVAAAGGIIAGEAISETTNSDIDIEIPEELKDTDDVFAQDEIGIEGFMVEASEEADASEEEIASDDIESDLDDEGLDEEDLDEEDLDDDLEDENLEPVPYDPTLPESARLKDTFLNDVMDVLDDVPDEEFDDIPEDPFGDGFENTSEDEFNNVLKDNSEEFIDEDSVDNLDDSYSTSDEPIRFGNYLGEFGSTSTSMEEVLDEPDYPIVMDFTSDDPWGKNK